MIRHINIIKTGSARQRPFLTMAGGSFQKKEYPIYCIELEHETKGKILIDTGYGTHFLSRLKKLPQAVYGKLFIEKEQEKVEQQMFLKSEYDWLFLSHFHPDHLGGICEVNYRKLKISSAIEQLKKKPRIMQLRQGFFRELLPQYFEQMNYFEAAPLIELFELKLNAHDLFGDQSICAINMPGHALGQFIFYLQTIQGPVLLAIDVAWHLESITEGRLPNRLTKVIVHNFAQMKQDITCLAQIHEQQPELPIFLSHCETSLSQLLEWNQKRGGAIVGYQEI
ncbi:MBL fold metallo-hydrolase [Enterococcus sp. AZ101]|uniref:MBL fold metallo-hydrolase n=1 Tax=Enterococcus sp. AZ101 TaxID=2774742 RepID=UPI003D273C19